VAALSILVIHPDHQRRGLGTMLVSDGCKRAHAQGLPVLLTASPKGAKLYPSLGFQTLAAPVVSSAKLQQPIMVFEPPRYDFVRVVEGK
jgi:predicted N-acetyltransferase YhbS